MHSEIESIIFEKISEGIIAVDNDLKIRLINRKAKEIFGIVNKQDIGHAKGKIEDGDIIVIGDNSIGTDDGGIIWKDLKVLGIHEQIQEGSAFIYIGRYNESGIYKFSKEIKNSSISIESVINNIPLKASVDLNRKIVDIKVGNISFPYSYIKGIGHIVVLDKNNYNIKFYQSKGYTVRREDLKNLLSGSSFSEKLPGIEMETPVINEIVTNVLDTSEAVCVLEKCAKGNSLDYKGKYDEINGRPVRCSVYPLDCSFSFEGAFLKVEDLSELNKVLKEKDEIYKKLREIEDKVRDPFSLLVSDGSLMKNLKSVSKKAALSNLTILLLGESGTGKSLLARAMHDYSHRRTHKFVEINCGALSETLLESELFGYVPGAFTGANKEGKKGLIEYADGGTLFLDEISELPLNLQVKLLHVIQNKRFVPVGGIEPVEADVRFICASNKDMKKMVLENKFREDLYYRINVMSIELPPLRERKEDLFSIVQSTIKKICARDNIQYKSISDEAFNKLYSYDFPGNIRELENIIERAANFSEGNVIDIDDIVLNNETETKIRTLDEIVEDTEKKVIINYLRKFNNDRNKVIHALGIGKTSFYEKVKKYNISLKS